MNVDSKLLPHRMREGQFRRFEKAIKEIVDKFPEVVPISAGKLSPLTVVGRLRDAMLSLHRYRWSTDVDMHKFEQIYSGIDVSHRGVSIIAGGHAEIKQFDPLQEVQYEALRGLTTSVVSDGEVEELSLEALRVVCKAAAKGFLTKPLLFSCASVGDEYIVRLEDEFDVRIDKVREGVYSVA